MTTVIVAAVVYLGLCGLFLLCVMKTASICNKRRDNE
jgi:hypothetical protein